jgi:hypothetical protein
MVVLGGGMQEGDMSHCVKQNNAHCKGAVTSFHDAMHRIFVSNNEIFLSLQFRVRGRLIWLRESLGDFDKIFMRAQ